MHLQNKKTTKNKTKTYGLATRLNCNSALSLHSFGTIFSALRKLAAEKWTWYTPSFLFIFLLFIKISLMPAHLKSLMIYILDVYGDRTLSWQSFDTNHSSIGLSVYMIYLNFYVYRHILSVIFIQIRKVLLIFIKQRIQMMVNYCTSNHLKPF